MSTFGKEDKLIETGVGETFSIELESNPTTGYQWQEKIDRGKVELIDRQFELPSKAFGAAGKEVLTFKSLSEGDSVIQLDYRCPWEDDTAETIKIKLSSQKK